MTKNSVTFKLKVFTILTILLMELGQPKCLVGLVSNFIQYFARACQILGFLAPGMTFGISLKSHLKPAHYQTIVVGPMKVMG